MTGREALRLRRAFTAALAALGPCAAVQACASSPSNARDAGAAHDDATLADVADPDLEGGDEALAAKDASLEAGRDARSCGAYVSLVDAGLSDADADVDNLRCSYRFGCGIPAGVTNVGCAIVAADVDGAPLDGNTLSCRLVEGYGCEGDAYVPTADGAITVLCADCLGGSGGRHTAGVRRARVATDDLGAYFARAAHAEAASVHAFRRMGRELAAAGAPQALVRATRRAARDEIAHARAMRSWAAAAGAGVPAVRVRVRPAAKARALEALARENAVEGCVHETFFALVATHQATHAADGRLRRTFARIAIDETRHAALAWTVARWAEGSLRPRARRRVERARAAAIVSLRSRLEADNGRSYDEAVGNPKAARAARLLDALGPAFAALALAPKAPPAGSRK